MGKISIGLHGESGHLSIFTLLKHSFEALNDAFEVQFLQGFILTPYQRH